MAATHWSVLPILLCAAVLSSCGSSSSGASYEDREESSEFDEDEAKDSAVSDLNGQTFQDVGDTSRCTQDCSGHDDGWQWAQDNDVRNASDCSGSGSFEDGCEAYVEELDNRVQEARDDAEEE